MTDESTTEQSKKIHTIHDYREMMLDFLNCDEYKELAAYYEKKSPLDKIIARKEKEHSNFLAWLLDDTSGHGLGNYPLRKLLELSAMIVASPKFQPRAKPKRIPEDLVDIIISGNYDLDDIEVNREYSLSTDKDRGNIDIVIMCKITSCEDEDPLPLRIFIENKVNCGENVRQTPKYSNIAKGTRDGHRDILIFLTPLSNRRFESLQEPECECKDFIQLNYQYLANHVISNCLHLNLATEARVYIEDYLRILSVPARNSESERYMIMAISKDERELLQKFFNAHEDIIRAAINAQAEIDEGWEDANIAVNRAPKSEKDYTRYYLNNKSNKLPKGRLVHAIVSSYLDENPEITFEELEAAFPRKFTERYGVIERTSVAAEKNHLNNNYFKDDLLILKDGTEVAVCSQWGKGTSPEPGNGRIDPFIEYVQEKFGYDIKPDR